MKVVSSPGLVMFLPKYRFYLSEPEDIRYKENLILSFDLRLMDCKETLLLFTKICTKLACSEVPFLRWTDEPALEKLHRFKLHLNIYLFGLKDQMALKMHL